MKVSWRQEIPARGLHRLTNRLAGAEVVAEKDGIEPCIALAVSGEPASRRHALAILLVVPVLRDNELGQFYTSAAPCWRSRSRPVDFARRHVVRRQDVLVASQGSARDGHHGW